LQEVAKGRFGFTVSDHARDDQPRIVKSGAKGMTQ